MLSSIKQSIKEYIEREFYDNKSLEEEVSLFDLGVLNSIRVIQIIAYIQDVYDIKADPSQILIEDFESIKSIADFIVKWRKEA